MVLWHEQTDEFMVADYISVHELRELPPNSYLNLSEAEIEAEMLLKQGFQQGKRQGWAFANE